MTTPFLCLGIVATFPYLLTFTGAYFKAQQFGSIDNNYPRAQSAALEGIGARAWAAQQNAWEALLMFTIAVFVGHLSGADAGASATTAWVFVAARVAHAACYLADFASARSLAFVVGIGCVVRFFLLAAA
jgi:uncharacterized MAPEG superfamily protein